MNVFDKIQAKLNDTEFLKNLRTTVILLFVIAVPFVYFGIVGNITLETIMTFKVGALAIMSAGLVALVRADIRMRAFDDELKQNTELAMVEKNIEDATGKIKDHLKGRKFVAKYNKDEQQLADEQKTADEIERLKQKIAVCEIKGKFGGKYKRLKKRVEELGKHPLHAKTKPISYDELYQITKHTKKKGTTPKEMLNYSPTKENVPKTIFSTLIKGVGLGGAGSIPFMIGESLKTIFAYYFTLLLAILITILQNYIITRRKTAKQYKHARVFKLGILKDCVTFIDTYKEPEVIKEEKTEEQKREYYELNRTHMQSAPS